MATYNKNKPKSNVAKSAKKSSFKFKWWMAVVGVGLIALVGIVVLRFSHAGQYGHAFWKQSYVYYEDFAIPVKFTPWDITSGENLYALIENVCWRPVAGGITVHASTRHEHGMGGAFSRETPYDARLDLNNYSTGWKTVNNTSQDFDLFYPVSASKGTPSYGGIGVRVITDKGGYRWRRIADIPVCP